MSTHELNFSQQRNFVSPEDVQSVHLLGAGSVGSHVASMLARIGVTGITVWDDDSVDSHNIGPSLYGKDDFGRYKVDALATIVKRDTGIIIKTQRKKYVGEPMRGTVLCCVDSMEARQAIWKSVRKNPFVDIFIDTRVAEEFFQVFSVKPCNEKDAAYYENFLAYNSSQTAPQMCGLHSIIYVSSMVAAEAVSSLAKFWKSGRTNLHIERSCGSETFINTGESNEAG
jgi:molybdopterin/thiamine biosynthesis adenylyltransferase